MAQSLIANAAPHTFSDQLSRRLKHLFIVCIVISLTVHVTLFICVINVTPTPTPRSIVSYIDIKDIAATSQQLISDVQAPVQPSEQQEPVQEPPARINDAIQSDNPDSTENASNNDLTSPLVLGMANGYFSSLADGRTLRDDIRGYYFDILEKINRRWWQTAGTIKEVALQDGIIEIMIGRDGELLGTRQIRSTGSRVVDKLIADAITQEAPYPTLPASYASGTFQAPLKITKPSYLFNINDLR